MHESVHAAFTLGERYLSILVPEGLVAHHGVSLLHVLSLSLEELLGQFVEGIVGESCVSYYHTLLYPVGEFYLGYHVVH